MKLSSRLFRICILLVLVAFLPAKGTIVPGINLEQLAARTDVIAIGRISQVQKVGVTTVSFQGEALSTLKMRAYLDVKQSLKGAALQSRLTFTFDLPLAGIGYVGIAPNIRGLFAFSKTKNGELRIYDPYHPFLVADSLSSFQHQAAYDRLIEVIEAAAGDQARTEGERLEALHELNSVRSTNQLEGLRPLLAEPNQRIRLRVASLLISSGDVNAFLAIEPQLRSGRAIDDFAGRSVALAISNFVTNAKALPPALDLLQHGAPSLRASAALALRNIGSVQAIQPLLNALNDPDREVRFDATLALTGLTGQYQLGTMENEFHRNQAEVIQGWKKWALKNGYSTPQ